MSIEYYEISARDLTSLEKRYITTDNVTELVTKLSFDKLPYSVVSNSQEHYAMLAALFSGCDVLLKYRDGVLIKWNKLD